MRKHVKPEAWQIVQNGYALVAVDYTSDDEAKWPAQGEDILDLVRFFEKRRLWFRH
jgi:acetyl esterase/lipase